MPLPSRVVSRGLAASLRLGILAALGAWGWGPATTHVAAQGETGAKTVPAIREPDLELRLGFLASDVLEGRETATAGARAAGEYIAHELERAGLEPAGTDGWFQPYALRRPLLGEGNVLELATPGGVERLDVEKDWNPFSVSPSAEARGALVFAGYGISAPDRAWRTAEGEDRKGWDDYDGVDVEGRVVLVLRKDPGWNDTRHAAFLAKLSNAARHGAAAVLLCNDPQTTKGGKDQIGHWSAPIGAPTGSARIPFAFVSQDVASRVLAPLGLDLDALEAALRAEGPRSAVVPETSVTVRTAITHSEEADARNVLGLLRGRDPALADEVVVVGAHFDHLGLGRFGSLGGSDAQGHVHPGADDNASGTSALLELAEYFGAPEHRPRRSLLFLAFSGEEMGLLGSRHYVAHPVLPLDRVVLMLNLDMVGRSREGALHVGGVGTAQGLKDLVARANDETGFSISWDPQGTAPSDSTSFFSHKVPVLFFFTGMHPDYHRPSDVPERIDYPALCRVARLVGSVVTEVANADERLVYTDPPPVPRPPFLGLRLSPEPDSRGVAIAGVRPQGPAAAAGLEDGDVIVTIADQIVRGPQDLWRVLSRLKAGKPVPIEVLRGTERIRAEIVPVERPGRR